MTLKSYFHDSNQHQCTKAEILDKRVFDIVYKFRVIENYIGRKGTTKIVW